ncbi:condensation domain-containing protein [Saccharothrix deserti]|uniref:condensation domain-containing protein n=1 Tax=Saccharothrix deserti TaxID=2593674 RepID=UPI00131B477F|nr:condensation domain-containing protein [Saccharothrix deserti]
MSSSSYVGGVGSGPVRDYSAYYVLPAAPAQRQLWFLCQLEESANAAYNVVSAVRLAGRLDTVLLQRALNAVVARHESLRTGVGLVDGEPHQLVVPETLVSLPVVDFSDSAPAEFEARLRGLAREQAEKPFVLDEPPLLRVVLVRESAERHTLITVIHHVVCDGWSTEVFYADLARGYRSLVEGQSGALPEPPIQYGDYVAWQQESLSGDRLRDLTAHWQRELAGTTPLNLPVDRPRGSVRRRAAGARVEARLGAAEVAELAALAEKWDATPFMLLLAAFKTTLARVTGQSDIAVGTPVAGRHHPDAEELIGFFANTLVLRTRLPVEGDFGDVVAAIRETCLNAFSHQQMPFDRLVEVVGQARVLDRNPLFDVMFSFQNTPGVELELPDLSLSPVALDNVAAKFDLWLTVLPDGDGLLLRLDYDRDLYTVETARLLLDRHRDVLAEVCRDPRVPVAALPVAGAAERAAIGKWGRGPETAFAGTVARLVADRDGALTAVSDGTRTLTHAELRARVEALAERLRAEGVPPGTVVTVSPTPSVDLVVAVLAAFEVGAAVAYGERQHRAGVFVRSAADEPDGWVVTTGPRFDPEESHGRPAPDLAAWWLEAPDSPDTAVLSHRALAAAVAAVADRLALSPADDVVLVGATRPHPVELLLPLARGGRLIFSPDGGATGAVAVATAPVWRQVLIGNWAPPPGVRVVCRGAVLADDLAEALERTGREVLFWRETGGSAAPAGLSPLETARLRRLGPPPAGTTRQVLDGTGAPTALGVVGELFLAGPATAFEQTGESTAPQRGPQGIGTGVLCRYTAVGELEEVGYTDDRVAVGDHVVSPVRVERFLSRVDGVRAAAVVPGESGGETKLVGWLVLDAALAGGSPREREEFAAGVRAKAASALAPHEVPALFGTLDVLPLLADGTPDRAVLSALRGPALLGKVDDTAPRNRTERAVMAIFQQLLPVRGFGVHADFFALGGHSLLAAKVIGRVRDDIGVLVPVRDFFAKPTAAGLAEAVAAVEAAQRNRSSDKASALRGQLAGMTDQEVERLLRQLG